VIDNEFQEIKLESVEITAQMEAGRRTATIERAKPTVSQAHPGELVDVEVSSGHIGGNEKRRSCVFLFLNQLSPVPFM